MKLLFVGTSKTGGGTETHFITLAKALTAAGHEVAALVRPGCPIEQGLKNSKVRLYAGAFRNSLDFRGVHAVNLAIDEFSPDWLIGSFSKEYWPLIYISRRRKVPLALFRHMATKMKRGTQYFIPRLAQKFIVISDFMKDLFVERGVPSQFIHVLHNPLDLDYFKPDDLLRQKTRRSLGLSNEDFLVGYVGAMHPGKGIYLLHKAMEKVMSQLPNVYMLWVGTGVDVKRFNETIDASIYPERNIRKDYTQDVRPWYSAIDVLAVPSIEFDTFGRVSIEAQACGTPVIGSRLGGIVETLEDGKTGILLPPGDAEIWANSIIDLAIEGKQNVRSNVRGYVSTHFGPDQIAEKFIEILQA